MPSRKPVRWIFFDVGDVLFDETPPHRLLFHTCLGALRAHGKDVTWDEYNARRKDLVRNATGSLSPLIEEATASFCDGPDEAKAVYADARRVYEQIRAPRPYGVLVDDIQPMLERLSTRAKLGVVANQHAPCLEGIRQYGLASLLPVIVLDSLVGVSKPDPEIFHLALEQAGCTADEAIYVGDRPDHDVAPAKALGFRTVRFRYGCHYIYCPARTPAETPDATVEDLSELERVLEEMIAAA